jgi:prolyl oligopeptidase
MPLDQPTLSAARVVVPEGEAAIVDVAVTQSRLYLQEMVGGPTRIRAVDLNGRSTGKIDTPEVSRVSGLTALDGDRLLFRRESFLEPEAWYVAEPGQVPAPTVLVSTSPATFDGCEVLRETATADDGVEIPISILRHRDTALDGTAPCILYAYGSYGNSLEPSFDPTRQVWLEQGGIYVLANVRGGGEFGDAWHRAANLERKKRSMDDLAACARHLVERHYTSPSRLALEGGSAGGLLVYGTMVHHPTLMSAVVSYVGIGDALREEFHPNGQFNVTEFGSVRNETQFKGLIGYSPYHHLKDGTTYPAVLSVTGLNDPRVAPWQSFKMTARLLATGSPNPVLLRVSKDTGHGGSTSLSGRDAETVDVFGFLFKHFGVAYRTVERRAD